MNKVLFSIVTVCYNCESSIEKTMKSVLGQEFKDYEYIIVDGASKDKTVDVIKRYLPQFEGRMRYVSEPDKGIYDAFTKGVNMMLEYGYSKKDVVLNFSKTVAKNSIVSSLWCAVYAPYFVIKVLCVLDWFFISIPRFVKYDILRMNLFYLQIRYLFLYRLLDYFL